MTNRLLGLTSRRAGDRRAVLGTAGALSVLLMGGGILLSCQSPEAAEADAVGRVLRLDPDFDSSQPLGAAEPASDYTLFEADPVRPVAVLERSGLVAVANTVDDYLELLRPKGARGLERCGEIQVGLRPVAVAVVEESARRATLWVVNHLSDSVSVVQLRPGDCEGEVVRTVQVGDEPRDIVVAPTSSGAPRVFVATAHRGQHHPVAAARSGSDLVVAPAEKQNRGLADVFVFDAAEAAAPPRVVNLFTDTPRALAVGDGVVYAAGFRTGNRTTAILAERVLQRSRHSLLPLLARTEQGQFLERDGELVLAPGVRGVARIEGGTAAVVGSGRCMRDPRHDGLEILQGVCVLTDAEHRVDRVIVQAEGVVDERCQCTSGDGTLQPVTSVIVQFFDDPEDCGASFTSFPDGTQGCWLDAAPGGVTTPAAHAGRQSPPMAWNDDVRLSLPDQDVFAIDVDTLEPRRAFSGVGTTLFNLAVQPRTGKLFVTNTEAKNLTRFEGLGESSSTTVLGHLAESRVTVIDPARGSVSPVHLNDHIDYGRCCERVPDENEKSLAFPTGIDFSADGAVAYFTALGSDKLVIAQSAFLERFQNDERARARGRLVEVAIGRSPSEPAGPVGLALDRRRGLAYVKTHFTNELVAVDARERRVVARVALPSPEPESIRRGRHVLYDARLTSSHGDSACASCHVFGDFDGLSWDLGDPDNVTVTNPGPFSVSPQLAALEGIAVDPFGADPNHRPQIPDFRSNKGPMNTQTLRGMANHGAQHWRGDRTRRFQEEPGRQPNFGTLDEANSFGEFDVAIHGLNGNDVLLEPELFQAFTNFSLQLTLPPNPIRPLDDSLSAEGARGRSLFFGCASMSDAQYERRECTALDGSVVNVDAATHDCECASNPAVSTLGAAPQIQGFGGLLQALLAQAELREAFLSLAQSSAGLPEAEHARAAQLAAGLTAAVDALGTTDLSLNDLRIFSFEAAGTLSALSGNVLGLLQLSAAHATPAGPALLSLLSGAIPPGAVPEGSPLRTPEGLASSFGSAFALANVNLRALGDELARGSSEFRDLLGGCAVGQAVECKLRVTDSLATCHGCHTLDPSGNAEFDVYRPGFFGTNGFYSFENEPQIFKVPHLRNQYQKVGMFGMALARGTAVPESVLGRGNGGFFAAENAYQGPQVRGFGFLHDGAGDTLHRFHGAEVFAQSTPGSGRGEGGLPAAIPAEATRAECVERFRSAGAAALSAVPAEHLAGVALCSNASGIPNSCFLDPLNSECQEALAAQAVQRNEPGFPERFLGEVRPLCFQFGSALEGGRADGVCFPQGLREREDLEAFMLAFDSNLKPMVGQQVTFDAGRFDAPGLRELLAAAARGHCDAAVRQGSRGFLVTAPNGAVPRRSRLLGARGERSALGNLGGGPITVTCHPPQPGQAEARRSAFARSRGVSRPAR